MSDTTASKLQHDADKVAYAATTGLPRQNYDGMHMAHCVLTLKMLEATKGNLHMTEWPSHGKAEHTKAIQMIDEVLISYEKFLYRFGLIGDDYHEDYLNSAEGKARVAHLDEAEQWARTQFLALPDLPNF